MENLRVLGTRHGETDPYRANTLLYGSMRVIGTSWQSCCNHIFRGFQVRRGYRADSKEEALMVLEEVLNKWGRKCMMTL